jgi:O-antigen/teichoic acid export membrane protein
MNFKHQAQVDLVAAALSAGTMVALAYWGFGVWTLVFGAIVLFWVRAVGLTLLMKWLVPPSFRFQGAGAMFRFGGALMAVQLFWFVQSQSDVFIAGTVLSAHELGLYTTALFLTQILTHKFVPALNEVGFAAYSQIQSDRSAVASAFCRSARLVMLIAMPFYLGLAVTAEPVVLTVLGEKWASTAPLVQTLALAMPFLTLQLLFTPATNALGRPGIAFRIAVSGALTLSIAFLIGIQWGTKGMSWAWLAALPIHLTISAALALPVIGAGPVALARAVAPGVIAAGLMALLVLLIDSILPPLTTLPRLAILVGSGAAAYAAFLFLFARQVIDEALALVTSRPAEAAA